MSYIIRKTNGTTLGTILDGTIDDRSKTSLRLVGRNYSNYGQIIADDLVSLLENFAYGIAPPNPLAGQLWWNTDDQRLRVYNGSAFKIVSSCTAQDTGPVTTTAGDLWWDSVNKQLYVYDGTTPYNLSGWRLIGPQRNGSGAVWEQIADTTQTVHDVVSIYLNRVRVGIICLDAEFTPATPIAGFSTIKPGHNLNSSGIFNGTAVDSQKLDGVAAENYLRSDVDGTTTGSLTISNNLGLTIGKSANLQITTSSLGDISIKNTRLNGRISLYSNTQGSNTESFYIDGGTGKTVMNSAAVGDITTSTSTTTGALVVAGGVGVSGSLNVGGTANFLGSATAVTMPTGTANTSVATTEFVISSSGFLKNKIYVGSETYVAVEDFGVGNMSVVIDGVTVVTASQDGLNLTSGATAVTQPDAHNSAGNARVATTQFVKTATQWWGGSAKFVSPQSPNPGVNDTGSRDGDFWFQYI